jgi:hypothetical protein
MFEREIHSILTQLIAQEYFTAFTSHENCKKNMAKGTYLLHPQPYNPLSLATPTACILAVQM